MDNLRLHFELCPSPEPHLRHERRRLATGMIWMTVELGAGFDLDPAGCHGPRVRRY